MLYFLIVFVFVSIFLIVQNKNSSSTKYMIAIMVAYTVAIFAMMFYLSKDSFYYNVVKNYFSLPKSMWKLLMFTTIDRHFLIRLLNLSSLAVIYFSIHFALSFSSRSYPTIHRSIKLVCLITVLLEYILYDPKLYELAYLFLYPKHFSPIQIDDYTKIIHQITTVLNCSILILSIIILISTYIKAPAIRLIKMNLLGTILCYTLIILSYLFILRPYPAFLIKVSRIAGITSYKSMVLEDNVIIYNLFPYYLIVAFLAITYNLYRISKTHKQIDEQNFTLSKQIDASETTSKIFCHYIKNELLAIQSEVELVQFSSENKDEYQNIINRCNNLYERLDSIHRSTKSSVLSLTNVSLEDIINETISGFSFELEEFNVTVDIPKYCPNILADKNYFCQALHNIIHNSIDAMSTLPKERKNLTIIVQFMDNWITIMIKDTGIGINSNNLNKIFTPFFSSKPISKRWGLGLSLTHKIITAHEGKIEIESKQNIGTNVKIMLPNTQGIPL